MSQETSMQTWDLQKRNRIRTGERGMIPISLPGVGVYPAKDGHITLFVLAPGGADFPELVAWLRENGRQEDLDEEPYASLCQSLNMATVTQIMSNPESAAGIAPQLIHMHQVLLRFFADMPAVKAYEEGQGRRLLVGLVSKPDDLANNHQLRARDWFRKLDVDFLNTVVEFPGPPFRLSETPAVIARPPRLGEHTEEVLAALPA